MSQFDPITMRLFLGILGVLLLASIIGFILHLRVASPQAKQTIKNLNDRTKAWWVMCFVFAAATLLGRIGSTLLFTFCSLLALREYMTLAATKRADHRTLFWVFFVTLPIQYYLVYINWYGLFSVFIPVYGLLLVAVRVVISADYENFLARTATVQWGSMVCIYFVSHVPALLMLPIPGFEGHNARLLLFLAVVVQISDVLQYTFGKLFGKHKIAPTISPNKTIEGACLGILAASLVGMLLWWATPFSIWSAALISLTICIMGFFGGLTMSAIKRDRGVKDFGNLISGHGGMLDRIDSLCFSAPVFFHLVRYFYTY